MLGFFLYILLTFAAAAIFVGGGALFVGRWFRPTHPFLRIGAFGFCGMVLYAFTSNLLGLVLAIPIALRAVAIAFFVATILTVIQCRSKWSAVWLWIKVHRQEVFFGFIACAIPFIVLFLETYRTYIFDEETHRLVINQLLLDAKRIPYPTHPFLNFRYTYHYGFQLIAAGLVSSFIRSPSVAMDVLKQFGVLFGILFGFGLLRMYGVKRAATTFSILSFYFTGSFFFFKDSFTKQYIFGTTQNLVGFSLIEGLSAISIVIIPMYVAVLWGIFRIAGEAFHGYERGRIVTASFVLTVLLSGFALLGELQYLMALATFGALFILQYVVRLQLQEDWRWKQFALLAISAVVSMIIVTQQGGVLTGIVHPDRVWDQGRSNEVTRHFELPEGAIQRSVLYENQTSEFVALRPLRNIGFPIGGAEQRVGYVALWDFATILPAFGILVIIFAPPFVVFMLYKGAQAVRRRQRVQGFFALLLVNVLLWPLTSWFLSSRFGDINLSRPFVMSLFIFYGMLPLFLLYVFRRTLVLRIAAVALIILSWSSIILFAFTVSECCGKQVENLYGRTYHYFYSPELYQSSEVQFVRSIRDVVAGRRVLTGIGDFPEDDSFIIPDIGGGLTYRYFFTRHPDIYSRVIGDLSEGDLKVFGFSYLYLTDVIDEKLSATGRKNLAKNFVQVTQMQDGIRWYRLYKVL